VIWPASVPVQPDGDRATVATLQQNRSQHRRRRGRAWAPGAHDVPAGSRSADPAGVLRRPGVVLHPSIDAISAHDLPGVHQLDADHGPDLENITELSLGPAAAFSSWWWRSCSRSIALIGLALRRFRSAERSSDEHSGRLR